MTHQPRGQCAHVLPTLPQHRCINQFGSHQNWRIQIRPLPLEDNFAHGRRDELRSPVAASDAKGLCTAISDAFATVHGYAEGEPFEESGGQHERLPRGGWAHNQARPAGRMVAHHRVKERQRVLRRLPQPLLRRGIPSPRASRCLHLPRMDMGNTLLVDGVHLATLHAVAARPTSRTSPWNPPLSIHMTMFSGNKLGKLLATFPITYLSAGTCSALIIVGGGSMKLFFNIVCGPTCEAKPLTSVEWYLVFTCLAVILSQLPNLNSIAGVSLVGAVTAVSYCTIIWVVSVGHGRLPGVSYDPVSTTSATDRVLGILNAIGIIAFAFRGHNLVLEIQATMPSSVKHPSRVPMWRGVKAAYLLVAFCSYPIAICGFWAYGNQIPTNGILQALYAFHGRDTSQVVLGLTSLLVVINGLSSFQIYAMPMFDNMEAGYTGKKNKPCPWWLRSGFRALFGAISFLIAVAFPFLSDLAGLIGGIALPVTLAYPCFMWIVVKKPARNGAMWYINWALGCLGMGLSVVLVVGGLWRLIDAGLKLQFFKPQ